MEITDLGKVVSAKLINSVIGRVFTSTSFSLTVLGVLATAGVLGPMMPIALGAMWGGISLYVLNETGRKYIDHKDRVNESINGKGRAKK